MALSHVLEIEDADTMPAVSSRKPTITIRLWNVTASIRVSNGVRSIYCPITLAHKLRIERSGAETLHERSRGLATG